nr:hypothetical protein [Tanacetum cinerariifolium]
MSSNRCLKNNIPIYCSNDFYVSVIKCACSSSFLKLLNKRNIDSGNFSKSILNVTCVGNKMHKAFPLPAIKFLLPEELPTASEDGSHCQKKKDVTARKIAQLSMRITFNTHLTFTFKSKQDMDQQYPTVAKIPVLDTGKFKQWQFRMQQYLQHEHYAMWEVIEFKDSYEVPANDPSTTTTNTASGKAGTKSRRTVTLTTEDIQKKKNDVKARTTLLLSLPDEHQLRFSKYKTARELWAVILKTFCGNEAAKKTKKNLLKQQYGNFRAEGLETLEQTFTRLQVIIGQLQFMDVEVEQDDLNQKSTKENRAKYLEHGLISSAKHSRGNDEVNTASVYTASSNVPTASANVATVSISQETACAYIASQSSGSQIKFEDINQIDEDDMEEMDIKWNMALLNMRADKFWKKTGKKINIQGSDVARICIDGQYQY